MRKIIASVIIIFLLFIVSCGKSIKSAQEFTPNSAPVIETEKIISTMSDGSEVPRNNLISGMNAIKIYVPAYDPEKKPLTYEFTSPQGSFTDKTITNDGCSIFFYITGTITGGMPVNLHIVVKDEKNALSAVDYNIGTGKAGANVSASVTGPAFIQSTNDSAITFSCNCDGMYQVYCDNSVSLPANALMRDDLPVYRYKKDSGGNYAAITIPISGPKSSTEGKSKLKTINAPNTVWIVFSDNINPDISVKCTIDVDDLSPSIISRNPASNTAGIDSGTSLISIGFSEPVNQSLLGGIILSSGGINLPLTLQSYSASNNSAVFSIGGSLGFLRTYTIDASAVKDLAGNTLSNASFYFTTKEAGQLSVPNANISDGQIFDAATTVTLSSPEGGNIRYTLDGSAPSATSGTLYTGPISISLNTKITAIAYGVSGYLDSTTSAVTCKIRAPKPKLTYTDSTDGDKFITVTPPLSGTIYYTTNEDDPDTSLTGYTSAQSFYAAGNIRNGADVLVKAIATKANMEPSSIESGEYIVTYPSLGSITYSLTAGAHTTPSSGTVTITSSVSSYTSKYSIDGTNPEGTGGKTCSNSLLIYNSFSQTLRIIAYKEKYSDANLNRTFTINNPIFVYVANSGSNTISSYAQNSAGALETLPSSPFSAGYSPYAIETHPVSTSNFIYVTDTTNTKIHSYSFDSAGKLTELNALSTGTSPIATTSYTYDWTNGGILTTTSSIYVCNQGSDSVSGYSIGTDGKLANLANSPWSVKSTGVSTTYAPVSIAIAQGIYYQEDTAALYTANSSSNNMSHLHLDLKGGGLYNIQTSALYGIGFSPRVITSGYFYDATTPYSWFSVGCYKTSSHQIQNFWMDNSDETSNESLSYCSLNSDSTTYPITSMSAAPQIFNNDTLYLAVTRGDSSSGLIYMYSTSKVTPDMYDEVALTSWSNSINIGTSYGTDPASIKIAPGTSRIYFINRTPNTLSSYYIGSSVLTISTKNIGTPVFYQCGSSPKSLVVRKGYF